MDLRSGELLKDGLKVRLQAQPFLILALLAKNAGEVVTRDEIRRELWPRDTFVDFEHSLAAAVNKIREALGDSADDPRYIETLPKPGYRFIGKSKPEPPVEMPVRESGKVAELATVPESKAENGWNWIVGTAAVIVALAVGAALLRAPHKASNLQPMTIVPFTSYPGLETAPSSSPDGSRIAFAWDHDSGNKTGRARYDLYVKVIGSETLLKLTNHPSDWISSTWSPDGTQIAFHRVAGDDNGIYVVPALGGSERKLIATQTPYDLAAPLRWSPDGKWIAYSETRTGWSGNRSNVLNVETLETRELPHDATCRHEGFPPFSPSGKKMGIGCVHNRDLFEIDEADANGGSRRSLANFHQYLAGLAWTPGDESVVVEAWAAGSGNRELDEVRVSDGETRKILGDGAEWPATSTDGTKLAYTAYDSRIGVWRKDLQNPEAPAEAMFVSTRPQNNSQYSPDGKHVAFDLLRSGTWSLWMADADGSNPVQRTHQAPAGYPRCRIRKKLHFRSSKATDTTGCTS